MKKVLFALVLGLSALSSPAMTAMESVPKLKKEAFDTYFQDNVGFIIEGLEAVKKETDKKEKIKMANKTYGGKGKHSVRKRLIEWCTDVYDSVAEKENKQTLMSVIKFLLGVGVRITPRALVKSLYIAANENKGAELVNLFLDYINNTIVEREKSWTLKGLGKYRLGERDANVYVLYDQADKSFAVRFVQGCTIYDVCILLSKLVYIANPNYIGEWLKIMESFLALSHKGPLDGLRSIGKKTYLDFILRQGVPGLLPAFVLNKAFREQRHLLNKILEQYLADKEADKERDSYLKDIETICSRYPELVEKKWDDDESGKWYSKMSFREAVGAANTSLMGGPHPELIKLIKKAGDQDDGPQSPIQDLATMLEPLKEKLRALSDAAGKLVEAPPSRA